MKTQYDYDYFINKFSAIPDEQWLECKLHSDEREWDAHCAVGHCLNWGFLETQESLALYRTIGKRDIVAQINNGFHSCYPQPTPKARILAALADAKARAEAALEQYEDRPLLPALPHDSGASSGTSQSRRFPARPVKVISASGPAPTGETAGAVPCCPMIGSTALLSGSSPDSPKPLSPVLQEQVIATDGPVSCEYLAGSSVAGRQA